MRVRENADLGICENQAANQVVLQITLDRVTEGLHRQTPPGFARNRIGFEPAPEIFFGHERLQHRIPDMAGKDLRQSVKLFHLLVFGVIAGQLEHRSVAHLFGHIAQKQSTMATVLAVGSKRSGDAAAQLQLEPEIIHDLLGKKANEIGVTRKPRLKIGKHFLRSGRAPDVIVLFQQQHAQTGPPQVARRHQAIVPGTQNHHVISGFHLPRDCLTNAPRARRAQTAMSDDWSGH